MNPDLMDIYLTLFHLSSGMTLLPERGPLMPGLILGFLNWPKDLLVPKTFSQMNILIFTFP